MYLKFFLSVLFAIFLGIFYYHQNRENLSLLFKKNVSLESQVKNKICSNNFYKDIPPYIYLEKMKKNAYPLCFEEFNVMYSGVAKSPFWTTQHLTSKKIISNPKIEMDFHLEKSIPRHHQPRLFDYENSDYMRWNLASSADMGSESSIYDSYSLANVTPVKTIITIDDIEQSIRNIVIKSEWDVYVVSGNIFSKKIRIISNDLFVADFLFKAIYIPSEGISGAYIIKNDIKPEVEIVSLCFLEEKTNINLFPTLSENQKRKIYNLPVNKDKLEKNIKEILKIDTYSKCSKSISSEELQLSRKEFDINNKYYKKYKSYKKYYSSYSENVQECQDEECVEDKILSCTLEKCTMKTGEIVKIKYCNKYEDIRYGVYSKRCFDAKDELIYEVYYD